MLKTIIQKYVYPWGQMISHLSLIGFCAFLFLPFIFGHAMAMSEVPVLIPYQQQATSDLPKPLNGQFDDITVQGNVDVVLQGGYAKSKATVTHQAEDTEQRVRLILRGQHLRICTLAQCGRNDNNQSIPVTTTDHATVVVQTGPLMQLRYYGAGRLVAKDLRGRGLQLWINNTDNVRILGHQLDLLSLNKYGPGRLVLQGIKTPQLSIHAKGTGKIDLRGVVGLQRLNYSGDSKLSLHWLQSRHLEINGHGRAQAFIAGVAQHVNIQLNQHAYLNARYLRAAHVRVKTRARARADVYPLESLWAFAKGRSHIDYYHEPAMMGKYMRHQGAVLSMVSLNHLVK